MIINKENWISQAMEKLNYQLVQEFMQEYRVSELNARKALAEMYYVDSFDWHSSNEDETNSANTVGYVQY